MKKFAAVVFILIATFVVGYIGGMLQEKLWSIGSNPKPVPLPKSFLIRWYVGNEPIVYRTSHFEIGNHVGCVEFRDTNGNPAFLINGPIYIEEVK